MIRVLESVETQYIRFILRSTKGFPFRNIEMEGCTVKHVPEINKMDVQMSLADHKLSQVLLPGHHLVCTLVALSLFRSLWKTTKLWGKTSRKVEAKGWKGRRRRQRGICEWGATRRVPFRRPSKPLPAPVSFPPTSSPSPSPSAIRPFVVCSKILHTCVHTGPAPASAPASCESLIQITKTHTCAPRVCAGVCVWEKFGNSCGGKPTDVLTLHGKIGSKILFKPLPP